MPCGFRIWSAYVPPGLPPETLWSGLRQSRVFPKVSNICVGTISFHSVCRRCSRNVFYGVIVFVQARAMVICRFPFCWPCYSRLRQYFTRSWVDDPSFYVVFLSCCRWTLMQNIVSRAGRARIFMSNLHSRKHFWKKCTRGLLFLEGRSYKVWEGCSNLRRDYGNLLKVTFGLPGDCGFRIWSPQVPSGLPMWLLQPAFSKVLCFAMVLKGRFSTIVFYDVCWRCSRNAIYRGTFSRKLRATI